jgi:quinol monooxygenase YgiN
MAEQPVRLLVEVTIYEEKFDQFEATVLAMVAGSSKETGTLGYDFYLSNDRRRCRLLETYANAEALLAHFKGPVVRELVPRFMEMARLERFEVFGDPGPEMQAMLKGFGADIFQAWHVL